MFDIMLEEICFFNLYYLYFIIIVKLVVFDYCSLFWNNVMWVWIIKFVKLMNYKLVIVGGNDVIV